MKAFLTNLLILFALGLCAVCAYQWHREAGLHAQLRQRALDLSQKSSQIQTLQDDLKSHAAELARLENLRSTDDATLRSNQTLIGRLESETRKLRHEAEAHAGRLEQVQTQYQQAFDKANENLKAQNGIIQSLNEKLRQLADDRNEVVTRFNKLAADYKTLGDDYAKVLGLYTNLVAQVQTANQKAAAR